MFENWVFQSISDPNHGSFVHNRRDLPLGTEDVKTTSEANQMRKIIEMQIYSLYQKKWDWLWL